jgi:hypothetical protein
MRSLMQWEEEAADATAEPEDRWLYVLDSAFSTFRDFLRSYQPLHATGVTAAAAAAAATSRARLLHEKAMRAVQELADDDIERQFAAAAAAAAAEQRAKEAEQERLASEQLRIDALVAAAEDLLATPAADRVLAAAAAADAAAAYIIDVLLTAVAASASACETHSSLAACASAATTNAAAAAEAAVVADSAATDAAPDCSIERSPYPLPNTHAAHVPNIVRCGFRPSSSVHLTSLQRRLCSDSSRAGGLQVRPSLFAASCVSGRDYTHDTRMSRTSAALLCIVCVYYPLSLLLQSCA